MNYYFLAQIRINNKKEYQKYLSKSGKIFSKYKSTYLAVDNDPVVLEGQWDYTRLVLIRFNSKKDFEDWYHSAEYQNILKHRLKAADCDTLLLKGLNK